MCSSIIDFSNLVISYVKNLGTCRIVFSVGIFSLDDLWYLANEFHLSDFLSRLAGISVCSHTGGSDSCFSVGLVQRGHNLI
jgi:hypothetical protein